MKYSPFYKLIDPFRNIHYLPLSAHKLSEQLEVSYRTAVRICNGQKKLKKLEREYLQIINFGLIPDPAFLRYRLAFRDGELISHDAPNLDLSAGKLAHLYVWQAEHLRLLEQLKAAMERIKELELLLNPLPPEPTNIIKFSDYFKG